MATRKYKLANVRDLLNQGFNEDELRSLCYEEPEFKSVYDNWPRGTPKSTFVHELIDMAERRLKLDALLDLAEKRNPTRYQQHQPYYEGEEPVVEGPPAKAPEAEIPPVKAAEADVPDSPPAGNDIFISYSRRDLDFVKKLYNHLTAKGISAWFDQTSIEIGDQWRETIVNGIMNCEVFVIVLSPDSAQSRNVRKEIDLAERHHKKIVPLIWRGDSGEVIPPAIAYQLAGVNYFNFREDASEENLNKIANVVSKLLGGASISEAAAGEKVVETKAVAVQATQPAETGEAQSGRSRRRRQRTVKEQVSAVATLGAIMARVVAPLSTGIEADEVNDAINNELEWLFAAADHLLRVRQGSEERAAPVPVGVPADVEGSDEALAGNTILATVSDFSLQMTESQVESIVKQINIYLRNLTFELDKQAQVGGAEASSIALRNSIQSQRKAIIERMQELARLMKQVYGIMVYGPDDLADELNKQLV